MTEPFKAANACCLKGRRMYSQLASVGRSTNKVSYSSPIC